MGWVQGWLSRGMRRLMGRATWESLRADAILRAGLSGTDAHATTIFARRCYALRNLGACMTVGLDGFRSSILMIKMH